ncbi:Calcium permeable stress-gated cation channel 1 [Vitis vinifera]|uniref:Calcium permeable stress-gated cation channel 1 n=1 Tax=Vitis vinifera TaxID=29760 RepID=A0A438F4H8_VITVI|nr:Calcium permeable stress-gated cation channel 1 [Vitis vinifera]
MATLQDISVAATINILSALAFLVAFAILRLQPFNDRVYFPKWYLKGIRGSPRRSGAFVSKFVNLDYRTYLRFLNWMPVALKMPEPELIDHAGLDSAVFIRIYLLGLKIFVPLAVLAFAVLVPVNWTGKSLQNIKDLTFSDIDKLSISNVPTGSNRFWAHIVMQYVFSFWTCYVLYKEYKIIATMRLHFIASENRRPDQFTVIVRNVPPDPDESVSEHIEHFFCVNHPDYYLTHRTGFCGLWGTKVDAVDHYAAKMEKLCEAEAAERERVITDPKAIMPAAFVSFKPGGEQLFVLKLSNHVILQFG